MTTIVARASVWKDSFPRLDDDGGDLNGGVIDMTSNSRRQSPVLSDSHQERLSLHIGIQCAKGKPCILQFASRKGVKPTLERVTQERKRTKRLLRGRGCYGRTRRVFRGLPAVYDDALVPPSPPHTHHPPLTLAHNSHKRAREIDLPRVT